jgi:two-component system KDP operon response regulator KdpE
MNRKKILIVDDSAVILRTLSMKLTAAGYEVVTADDGAGAVKAIRVQKPDAIVMDINFPPDVAHGGGVPWDGFLVLGWVSRLEEVRSVPILIISGSKLENCREKAIEAGAAHFFHKPVNNEEFLAVIHSLIGPGQPVAASQANGQAA